MTEARFSAASGAEPAKDNGEKRFGELGVDVLNAHLLATVAFPTMVVPAFGAMHNRAKDGCELQAPLNRAAIKRSGRCEVKVGGQDCVRSSGAMPGTAR